MNTEDRWNLQEYLSDWRQEQKEDQRMQLAEIKSLSVQASLMEKRAGFMEKRVDAIEDSHRTIRNGVRWVFTTLFVTVLGGIVTLIVGFFKPHP